MIGIVCVTPVATDTAGRFSVEETLKIKYATKPYVDPNAHNRIEYKFRLLIKSESLDTCSHKT